MSQRFPAALAFGDPDGGEDRAAEGGDDVGPQQLQNTTEVEPPPGRAGRGRSPSFRAKVYGPPVVQIPAVARGAYALNRELP
jgi:hypothetical protein